MILINGKNKILGRMCTDIAEKLLKSGERIIVVNSEDVIICGDKQDIFKKYSLRNERKGKGNPRTRNPKYPKYPDRIVKRTVRGMLPRNAKGSNALKKLMVYIGVPENYSKELPKEDILQNVEHITLKELSKFLGAKLK